MTPPAGIRIDLREDYGWALVRALAAALEFADEDANTIASSDDKHTEQSSASECDAEGEHVGVLCDFMAIAQARIDALAVEEGTDDVLDIAA